MDARKAVGLLLLLVAAGDIAFMIFGDPSFLTLATEIGTAVLLLVIGVTLLLRS